MGMKNEDGTNEKSKISLRLYKNCKQDFYYGLFQNCIYLNDHTFRTVRWQSVFFEKNIIDTK